MAAEEPPPNPRRSGWLARHRHCLGVAAIAPLALTLAPAATRSAVEWDSISDPSLEIVQGSALDFSAMVPTLPDTRLAVRGEQFAIGTTRTPPLNCATLGPGFAPGNGGGFPDHATATRYAIQLRRHGYNLVRFHFIDALLMRNSTQDLVFNPDELDRFQFFVAELRKQHIHWVLDILSSDNAGLGNIFPNRWSARNDMVVRTFMEPDAFAHWQGLARAILATPNPYTGLTLAQDPHTAALILVNEANLDFRMKVANQFKAGPVPPAFANAYRNWAKASGMAPALPANSNAGGAAMANLQRFLDSRQRDTLARMVTTIRALGYDGPYTSFDAWKRYNQVPTLRDLPLIDMHGYQGEQVSGGVRPGQRIANLSSFDDLGRDMQLVGSMRQFGKPMIVTEHDQVFWNNRRFESGAFAPAFAALQGWSFICRHADGPIDLAYDGQGIRKQAIEPDGVGLDPVARAAETLTALLWLRSEIKPLPGAIRFRLSNADALADGGNRQLPPDLGALGWIARIGLGDGAAPAGAMDVPLTPDLDDRLTAAQSSRTAALIARLRSAGLMGSGNATDPTAGLWDSPGGQVSLRARQRQLRIETPFTAALVSDMIGAAIAIGPVRFLASDAPALSAFSALDGKPLAQSSRILVILASDARNTGMDVSVGGTLSSIGKLPVQLRRTRLTAALQVSGTQGWRLIPLALNGQPTGEKQLKPGNGLLRVDLDSAMVAARPTTFFLLVRDK